MVNDINARVCWLFIQQGNVPFIEHGAQELLLDALSKNRLVFSARNCEIPSRGPVIVTIGTPVDEFLNPALKVMKECIDSLSPHLSSGQLLILRSTVYPGTTDWLSNYLQNQGRNVKVAFCPERVVQGHGICEISQIPQIVSGTSPEAENEAAALFSLISPEIVRVKPLEAEFAKNSLQM